MERGRKTAITPLSSETHTLSERKSGLSSATIHLNRMESYLSTSSVHFLDNHVPDSEMTGIPFIDKDDDEDGELIHR